MVCATGPEEGDADDEEEDGVICMDKNSGELVGVFDFTLFSSMLRICCWMIVHFKSFRSEEDDEIEDAIGLEEGDN